MLRLCARALVLLPGALALGSCGGDDDEQFTIAFHYSNYSPERLTVRAGEPVIFTLRNDDPIEHEWIVGSEDVHQGHRTGTHAFHDQVPTEVTVPAFTTRETTLTFEKPGEYQYICHLPGHEAYGMKGTIFVVEGDV